MFEMWANILESTAGQMRIRFIFSFLFVGCEFPFFHCVLFLIAWHMIDNFFYLIDMLKLWASILLFFLYVALSTLVTNVLVPSHNALRHVDTFFLGTLCFAFIFSFLTFCRP